jgi:hypothetical protein
MQKITGKTELIAEEYEDHKGEIGFRHFFSHVLALRLCGADEHRLYRVEIEADTHDDPGGYWGWWSNKDNRWAWVFGSKAQCAICFPYGSRIEEELGHGWMLPVKVTVLGKMEGGHGNESNTR